MGADVTGVCSTRNIEILKAIGTDHVIDYTKEDFTLKKEYYDLILGVNGFYPLSAYKRALKQIGRFVHVGGSEGQLFQTLIFVPFISMTGKLEMSNLLQGANQKDLIYLKELLEDEKIKPVIDRRYKISKVQEAFRYFAEGHALGKVIITV